MKIGDWWLERHNVEDIAEKLDLSIVPIIGEGTLGELEDFVRDGFKSQWGDFTAEGVVARPKVELQNPQRIANHNEIKTHRLSGVKNPDRSVAQK